VTTNIVTVPLVAALGIGLAASIRGRNALTHGFGLVALAVMVPMISVQAYGILVYSVGDAVASVPSLLDTVQTAAPGPSEATDASPLLGMLRDLMLMFRDVLPIIAVVVIFQSLAIRKPIAHIHKVAGGFVLVIIGLYAFVIGLKMGLFPIGKSMAEQLIGLDGWLFVYLFAFCIGFATTMAEPVLIAIGHKAEEAGKGRLRGTVIRLLVAIGVAVGITIGVHRIISGDSIHHYIMAGYALVILVCRAPDGGSGLGAARGARRQPHGGPGHHDRHRRRGAVADGRGRLSLAARGLIRAPRERRDRRRAGGSQRRSGLPPARAAPSVLG
jgi:hypothetical protein